MKSYIVKLKCITNMHVGNGDVNYNIIDNEVERDPITNYPMINASGVKGALREYFKTQNINGIDDIFGTSEEKSNGKSKPGKVKILGAEMVAIPARATAGDKPYYMVTTREAIERINNLSKTFIGKNIITDNPNAQAGKSIRHEVEEINLNQTMKMNGDSADIYVMENTKFELINLPVVARNKLDNGESKNLWYEEIVPHESIFIFPIVSIDDTYINSLKSAIHNKVIQFGGNASIGYGLCKVTVIE